MSIKARNWSRAGLLGSFLALSCTGESQPAPTGGAGSSRADLVTMDLTINVVGPNGEAVSDFRWLVERDMTYHVDPGVPDPATLAVRFHRSHMPVEQAGRSPDQPFGIDAEAHHYVSVLPDSGYAMGGAQVAPGQTSVTIVVNSLPLPTAQLSVIVFRDDQPINNAIDQPVELGLEGFSIHVEDAGGKYGQNGGTQMVDAFGNPLGTTYDANGAVLSMGDGVILTGADGTAVIKNLAPGKYGISAVPPTGSNWVQTTTIEGTAISDAWVKANEPGYFMEFGPPGYHVNFGFVQPMKDTSVLSGGSNISGQVVNLHMSRPPDPFYNGAPLAHTRVWVGLNTGAGGTGRGVFVAEAQPDGSFSIPDVPPGSYQIAIWDKALDQIFATHDITVNADGTCNTPNSSCDLGEVPVFQWFTRIENYVFNDLNGNGFRDPGELGIPEQNINIRWRDGTINQAYPTDGEGFVPFDQVFPFFNWQVAEVDFTRFEATGVTVTVDDGGPIDPTDHWSWDGQLNPQIQSDTGLPYRIETGPVLTQAFQGFIGQTSVIEWGKRAYAPGENGGISGIVFYAVTRAEDDPRYAAAETWEPGVPNVTVNLWDETGTVLLNSTETDSWDATPPTGCEGPAFAFRGAPTDCFDGLKNFNQVRPGVFDGGYAFTSYFPEGYLNGAEVEGLPAGDYIVEVIPPEGYLLVKEEDRNVDFGDSFVPTPQQLPPPCVGAPHTVPDNFSLFQLLDENDQPVAPFRAGEETPLCDRKLVRLNDQANAAADFFIFTEVPIAAHAVGFVLDDTANEFDPNAPTFGEKFAPPWLPISVRDWTGREIAHTYTDEYGAYNVLVPSTYTVNMPNPSGVSPNMLTFCINSPTMADPGNPGGYSLDPYYNPQYSQWCYTMQFVAGSTTYLDTPVVPVAAHAGPAQYPMDCELVSGTPRIYSVDGPEGGPYVAMPDGTQSLTINAPGQGGMVSVPNPAYDGSNAKDIVRDYGFGSDPGTVTLGGLSLPVTSWTPGSITATVPATAATGQLEVTRADTGLSSINAVTVTVTGRRPPPVHHLGAGESIQAAIDAAAPETLILVPPGFYDELVIMWKPVKLQGAGEGSVINALKVPAEKLAAWRAKVETLITGGQVDLLPAQEILFGGIEPVTLFTEEGPGVLVLALDAKSNQGGFGLDKDDLPNARIDGFTITGGDSAGGIVVNGFAHELEISNNRVVGNNGSQSGGVRLGHAALVAETNQGLEYQSAQNDGIEIHHNQISRNSGLDGSGGGVSLYTGSEGYQVTDNFICGNLTQGDGGGIGHLGLSNGGLIARNLIVFNESFNQGLTTSGGGIAIMGQPPLAPAVLTPGAGSVKVIDNDIHGNGAGGGDGGGVWLGRINGEDAAQDPKKPEKWYAIDFINNLVTNNVAGLAGGGMSLSDAGNVRILQSVIANNDSTATAGDAFSPGSPNQSTPQPAGIASHAHSPDLSGLVKGSGLPDFSSPELSNSIVLHNRSFYFAMDAVNYDPPLYGLYPDPSQPVYDDLAVLGSAGMLDPQSCILTSAAGYDASNLESDPLFVASYFNGSRGQTVLLPEFVTALQAPIAFDEGGNAIRIGFGPLTLTDTTTLAPLSNYRISAGSPAADQGQTLTGPDEVFFDIDGMPRPSPAGGAFDIGANELQAIP